MSLPNANLIASSRKAAAQMATRDTSFIFNEWYVAAFAEEVGRELLARTLLGKRVVLYRTLAGQAVALEDRCAHRSFRYRAVAWRGRDRLRLSRFPLRQPGRVDRDTVAESLSARRRHPSLPASGARPAGLDLARRPATGRPEATAAAALAGGSGLGLLQGLLLHPGNYVSMHENLMDLTHLTYLHANTIGTPDYAGAPYELDLKEGHYRLVRHVLPTTLSPVWGRTTGLDGCPTAARITTSEFLSPGLHQVSATFYDTALPAERRPEFHIRTAHILTPETHGSMHYFIVHGRDFAQDDETVGAFMHEQLFAAFVEDVEGLGALEKVLAEADEDSYEISVASDAPAVATRTYLKRRADEEARQRAAHRVA